MNSISSFRRFSWLWGGDVFHFRHRPRAYATAMVTVTKSYCARREYKNLLNSHTDEFNDLCPISKKEIVFKNIPTTEFIYGKQDNSNVY